MEQEYLEAAARFGWLSHWIAATTIRSPVQTCSSCCHSSTSYFVKTFVWNVSWPGWESGEPGCRLFPGCRKCIKFRQYNFKEQAPPRQSGFLSYAIRQLYLSVSFCNKNELNAMKQQHGSSCCSYPGLGCRDGEFWLAGWLAPSGCANCCNKVKCGGQVEGSGSRAAATGVSYCWDSSGSSSTSHGINYASQPAVRRFAFLGWRSRLTAPATPTACCI